MTNNGIASLFLFRKSSATKTRRHKKRNIKVFRLWRKTYINNQRAYCPAGATFSQRSLGKSLVAQLLQGTFT
jgi:hypothetical protein